jgi:hypothetical protein
LLSTSKDITSPKPFTNSLPFGISFCSGLASCFVSVCVAGAATAGLDTVCDDDVLVALDEAVSFGASGAGGGGGGSTGIISIGAGGGGASTGGGGGDAIGLTGDTGFDGLVTFAGFDADI